MAVGSALMKLGLHMDSLRQQQQRRQAHVSYPCSQPAWWFGFGGYTVGAILHIIALGFAPASVLAPMNSVGLIANAIAAATILKERFGWLEGVSTAGTVLGVSLCAVASFLPHNAQQSSSDDSRYPGLWCWRDPWYLTFLGVCIVCGFSALLYVHNEETKVLEGQDRLLEDTHKMVELKNVHPLNISNQTIDEEDRHPVDSSGINRSLIGSGAVDITPPSLLDPSDLENGLPKYPRPIGVTYGFMAGLVGAQCVLQVKELVGCIQYSMDYADIWNCPQPYLSLIFLLLAVWLQIHFLNLGLARGDATLVVPTYYIFWTFFGTLGGFTKFHEVEGFSRLAGVIFSIGFALTIACIGILAVQEMTNLRRFVDERVPDMPEEQMDLATQEMQDKQLGSQVSLAMGLFPFSMLGRTIGRKRFRPLYQRFRRTRSTASDTALGDAHGEYTGANPHSPVAPYTLPHSLHLYRSPHEQPFMTRDIQQTGSPHRHLMPQTAHLLEPPPPDRTTTAARDSSRSKQVRWQPTGRHTEEEEGEGGDDVRKVRRMPRDGGALWERIPLEDEEEEQTEGRYSDRLVGGCSLGQARSLSTG
eukprot:GHVS01071440.1.p1 GENE.GHVS01071440.1~~GHVS01071440.1.p1  ORF type:complete len:664 (+),score=86.36 GHVS01071440.1:232-1992(+)